MKLIIHPKHSVKTKTAQYNNIDKLERVHGMLLAHDSKNKIVHEFSLSEIGIKMILRD